MSARQLSQGLQNLLKQAADCYRQGQAAQAERLCLDLLRSEPDHPAVCHLLGVVRAQQGRHAEALACYDGALKRGPDFALLYGRGLALRSMKRSDDALASFEAALRLNPLSAEAWNAHGNVLRDLNRPAEALSSFDKALAINPDMAGVLYNRSLALHVLNRLDEALASFDQALEFDPANVNILNNSGIVLQDMKRFEEALARYDRALAVAPRNLELRNNRAKALCESGRVAVGLSEFARSAAMARAARTPAPELPHKLRHDREQQEHLSAVQNPEQGDRLAGPAIRPDNNIEKISEIWRTGKPQVVVIDNLLTGDALAKLRNYCLQAPVWNEAYEGGYLGAWPEQGFACPLLAQIAEELSSTFPAIFGSHPLHYLWAFKYDSSMHGINIHADEAAVNVNFWITPDEANLDPANGGLVVWDAAAPPDWNFAKFNADHAAMRQYLAQQGAKSVTIPYRANRAVIFDSDLFHETDTINFRDGYLNRRINVTLLYGRREWGETPDGSGSVAQSGDWTVPGG